MKITAVVSAGNLCMRQHFFPVEKNRSCKHDHNTSRMCPRSAIFWDIFSKKKDFLFFGSGQQLTLYACAGGIACASQQIGESSKLCREGRKQSQAEHACVIFGQLFFFVFVEKCMFSYIRMFSFWHKKQTLNVNPSPVLVIILHPRTHQYIIHPHKYTY